jgi:regulator of sigma E protease
LSPVLLPVLGYALLVGPLIFLHELGHYVAGRACGVKVDAFSIGFGPELAGWTSRTGTRWKLSAFPIGGYVKFAGDMNPASVPDAAWLELPPEERARTFQAQPLWRRAVVVAAGPIANFLVAMLVIAFLATQVGLPAAPAVIGTIQPGSAAAAAGLQLGDRVIHAGPDRIDSFADLVGAVQPHPDSALPLTVARGRDIIGMTVHLGHQSARTAAGKSVTIGKLGISPAPAGPLTALAIGATGTVESIGAIAGAFGQLITGQTPLDQLGGPVKIATVSGAEIEAGLLPFLSLVALVSINLGFINLLPVPVLDGGHLMFYAMEAVRRRPLGPRATEMAFGGGLVAILALVLVVTVHDLGGFAVWKHLAGLIG